MTKTLDLGCGANPRNPFNADEVVGIDIREDLQVGIKRVDLAIEAIPFANESFDYISAYDFLGYIPRLLYTPTRRNAFVELLNEIYRVLKNGGLFLSFTPAYPHLEAFQDPAHINIITELTFSVYFDDVNRSAACYGFKGAFKIRQQEWRGPHLLVVMEKVSLPKGGQNIHPQSSEKQLPNAPKNTPEPKVTPTDFVALYSLGVEAFGKEDYPSALDYFEKAKLLQPKFAQIWYNLGLVHGRLGQLKEALSHFDQAIHLDPAYEDAKNIRATLSSGSQGNTSALSPVGKSKDYTDKLTKAIEHQAQQKIDEAEKIFLEMLDSDPNDLPALFSLGGIEHNRHHPEKALKYYERALELNPDFPSLLFNCGAACQSLKQYERALACYDKALLQNPTYSEVLLNRGCLLVEMKRHKDALLNYEELLKIEPLNDKALHNRGIILTDFKLSDLAIQTFERLLEISPNYSYALGLLYFEKLHACDWSKLDELYRLIIEGVRSGKPVCKSMALTAISNEPRDHLLCAQIFAKHFFPARQSLWRGEIYQHRKIKIAYVSPDLREHPVGHLIAGVFENHDKSKFELTAISLGIDDQSSLRKRIVAAFDNFIDVRQMTSRDIAELLRSQEVDILVDLAGYTADSRTDIFAQRPVPIQVNFLGYSSTMGVDYIDYIIADGHVIPEEFRDCYSEKVVHLPDTYMPTDSAIEMAETTPPRETYGLPPKGFVFCCFNHDYKLNAPIFAVWMNLLQNVPGSVLWLMKLNDSAERNLRQEATTRGVDPDRIVFASRVPRVEDHLARYRLADLYLDTTPCNAHSTTSDVLRAGLPLVTCRGKAFAGRVSASLLSLVDLPELITDTLQDYEKLAYQLATNKGALRKICKKLQKILSTNDPFDTSRYCRNLEKAYLAMWERYQRGEKPDHLVVKKD